jgi:radical SAM-linked protein
MRIRIKFTKNEIVKYLGHLDIMRTFQRNFNRAEVRMTYSEGFNPHQKMSFALPLGVGIASTGEYLDAEIADGQDLDAICRRLNDVSGMGFDVLSVRELKEGAEKAMAAVKYASYSISFDNSYDLKLDEYLDRPEVIIQKKTKTGIKDVDIKKMIEKISLEENVLKILLKAGSENNIKPELIAEDLFKFSGIDYKRDMISITRNDLFAANVISLIDYQTL